MGVSKNQLGLICYSEGSDLIFLKDKIGLKNYIETDK
jgi:hypothetical protein